MSICMGIRYTHDCNSCVPLGQYGKYDLYCCPGSIPTVIARYSDYCGDYSSSAVNEYAPTKRNAQLAEAIKRAITHNLI